MRIVEIPSGQNDPNAPASFRLIEQVTGEARAALHYAEKGWIVLGNAAHRIPKKAKVEPDGAVLGSQVVQDLFFPTRYRSSINALKQEVIRARQAEGIVLDSDNRLAVIGQAPQIEPRDWVDKNGYSSNRGPAEQFAPNGSMVVQPDEWDWKLHGTPHAYDVTRSVECDTVQRVVGRGVTAFAVYAHKVNGAEVELKGATVGAMDEGQFNPAVTLLDDAVRSWHPTGTPGCPMPAISVFERDGNQIVTVG